ncbi:acyl-CoA reductase [Parasediminibacterium sp. JCM 36343]|uniref:acyl-CoA reductase n=1 Tax=Parasediminibacterium sp. JCM 36343 TaxID=3374279 RepID=UPI00397890B4
MDLQERIKIVEKLGIYMQSSEDNWVNIKDKALRENPWFTKNFISIAINNIAIHFLQENLVQQWVGKYGVKDMPAMQKNVGIVMAGNIPLVGFHDFLCVFISGHRQTIKMSSKDAVLIKHLVDKLIEWDYGVAAYIQFAENLKGCDAYIATGSNNSSRYFDFYFGKYPNIIRRNRTSIALLDGDETESELDKLADDIQFYFGLGCRNITKLYVPTGYNFMPLLEALKKYDYYFDFHKYKHNYDYQLALLMMGRRFYMTNGSIVLAEEKSIFSPVSQVNYEFYTDKEKILGELKSNESIQCIVGKGNIAFGAAQQPSLEDYADGVDTMLFLSDL